MESRSYLKRRKNSGDQLVEKVGGTVIAQAAVLAEGDACKRNDIIYLETLPLFEAQ